jgi:hypothetical protein
LKPHHNVARTRAECLLLELHAKTTARADPIFPAGGPSNDGSAERIAVSKLPNARVVPLKGVSKRDIFPVDVRPSNGGESLQSLHALNDRRRCRDGKYRTRFEIPTLRTVRL